VSTLLPTSLSSVDLPFPACPNWGSVLEISGPPGVGKSSLVLEIVRDFLSNVEHKNEVLILGESLPSTRGVPF
jgi:putative protein kinase ArgK-like GTPase of G3E family